MKIWLDAQLSPHLAPWLTQRFGIEAYSVSHLGYLDATDEAIFNAAPSSPALAPLSSIHYPVVEIFNN